ncbi:protoporphyrinogen oxidase [Schizosaccharomyces japonicus yFS275]|uniref:Protoporphyrinogen oxidase n=1 Tax=Schizosaccharomyces japonicus (strain yFS275 / FY16936) TaxID=402676 RepID=B6K1F1_SCHJY|nr:protoporphyrinogen oxidase [Schizosaccharomyces japonicus yFS275]EEB07772.1 protoporphyrinogen oxidase [Schizosaccharomyces japonicus yFS275]
MSIAVCGGGIAGLSAAYYLARYLPKTQIVLLEQGTHLGGWLQSVKVPCSKSPTGSVLFEKGPRTLRPIGLPGLATLDLVAKLKLQDKILPILKSSTSAKNRYLYYPDRLNHVPSNLFQSLSMFMSPAFRSMPWAMLMEPFRRKKADSADESVWSFANRRFGPKVADRVMSALVHGIYAGDIHELSVKSSMFRNMFNAEQTGGSLILGMIRAMFKGGFPLTAEQKEVKNLLRNTPETMSLYHHLKSTAIFALQDGIETLSKAMYDALKKSPNVEVRLETPVTNIEPSSEKSVHVNGEAFSNVVVAMSSRQLEKVASAPAMGTPTSSVYLVNVYYKDPKVLPVSAFGYLVPSATPNNPHKVLGVVFDSDQSNPEQGTKLTVMMGGRSYTKDPTLIPSSPEKATEAALDALKQQLNITATPDLTLATLQRDCIPQYAVGHEEKLNQLNEWNNKKMNGCLKFTGSWYNGVAITDCILNGHIVARDLAKIHS